MIRTVKNMRQRILALVLGLLLLLLSSCSKWGTDVLETIWVTDETTEARQESTDADSEETTEEGETVVPPNVDFAEPDPMSYPKYLFCTMGLQTISPFGTTIGGIIFRVSTDAEYYEQGAPITLSLTLTNTGNEEVVYDIESGIRCATTGEEPEQWAETVRVTLPAGESRTVELTYETPMTNRLWLSDRIADYEILFWLRDPLSEIVRIRTTVPLLEQIVPSESFDESLSTMIREVYLNTFGEDLGIESIDALSIRSVISASGAEILFIDCKDVEYPDVVTTDTVEGLEFIYPNEHTMTVYYDGTLYSLQGAFDMSILTSEDIAALHEIWSNANPDLYGMT